MITVQDMDGTVHAALPSFHPGRTLCGYPPRRKDGQRWPMSSAAHSVEFAGQWSDVTCEWCRAELGPVRGGAETEPMLTRTQYTELEEWLRDDGQDDTADRVASHAGTPCAICVGLFEMMTDD